MDISIDLGKKMLSIALSRGASEAIVRLQHKIYELIVFDGGVIRSYGYSRVSGIGIRVVVDGGMGYSYTTSFDRDSIVSAIDRAIAQARAMSRYGYSKKLAIVDGKRIVYRTEVKVNPLDVDPSMKVELVSRLNRSSMSREGIASAITRYGFERDRRIVVSSYGAEAESDTLVIGISHMAIARTGDSMERVYDQKTFVGGYEHIEGFDWDKFVEEVDRLAINASKASTPSPGTYTAVIDNALIGLLLHEAFGHACEGDHVVSNSSVLVNKIGERVASDIITIYDDGSIDNGYPIPFDDEGVVKGRTIVVENGVLRHYLNSRYTSYELRQGVTGNARAQDISFDPIVRQTNFYLAPGDASVEELFEGISMGLYLRGRGAMGGEVNPSMGTFTFSIGPSHIIRNGEIGEMIRGVTVSGNILETLKEVDMVAKDLIVTTNVFGGCGKEGQLARVGDGGPHVRVRKIVVGGG